MSIPLLAPHVQLAWRDTQRLILEDPAATHTQVLIGNATPAVAQWLRTCDGTHALDAVLAAAPRIGINPASARALLSTLEEAGLLTMHAPSPTPPADVERAAALRQDLEAIALSGRDADAAYQRRREHHIWIEGVNRVAHAMVELLGAAHIGSMQARAQHAPRQHPVH